MELGVTVKETVTNPVLGDLMLTEGGLEVQATDLMTEVAQRLHVRLRFFKGEWFLDLDEGLPYYQSILSKGVPPSVIRSVFSQVILGTPGVAVLEQFAYSITRERELHLTFKARLTNGRIFNSADFGRFLVAT